MGSVFYDEVGNSFSVICLWYASGYDKGDLISVHTSFPSMEEAKAFALKQASSIRGAKEVRAAVNGDYRSIVSAVLKNGYYEYTIISSIDTTVANQSK